MRAEKWSVARGWGDGWDEVGVGAMAGVVAKARAEAKSMVVAGASEEKTGDGGGCREWRWWRLKVGDADLGRATRRKDTCTPGLVGMPPRWWV